MYYLLGTFGDGEYWRSGIEVLLYPTGCSFYRPFSYRKDWVGNDVIPTTGETSEGVIGFRFKKSDTEKFIPLRFVEKVLVGGQGEHHVRFVLGKFFVHSGKFTEFDLAQFQKDLPGFGKDKLLLAITGDEFRKQLGGMATQEELPPKTWDLLRDDPRIGKDTAAPEKFRTTLLRFLGVRMAGNGTRIAPTEIGGRKSLAQRGFCFTANSVYEIDIEFRTLMEPNSPERNDDVRYTLQAKDERMIASKPMLARTGNYREETVWVRPKVAEPAPCQLEWLPEHGTGASEAAPHPLALRVPYEVKRPCFLKFYFGVLLFGFLAILCSAALFVWAFCASGAIGGANKNDGLATVLSAGGAALLPVGIGIVAYWFQQFHSMKR